ncbi:MAG: CoA transferase, partial [Deltaproteobacteria bacterium]|nr:CoA transferase [Deltaproteobacteria bacterium]
CRPDPYPLKGIRTLDLTRVWSGPLAGRILADLGAEVIHILGRSTVPGAKMPPEEAAVLGIFPDDDPGQRPWDRMSQNNDFSRNKLGMTLELDRPEGIALFRQLVSVSDVVLENFSPRVMPNFGLDYAALKEINPAVVMCSMPGFGLTGPLRNDVSYGVNLDFFTGLASLMGYPDGEGQMSGNAYPDAAAAMHAVCAVLTALFHRQKTGVGQHIDLSQAESAVSLIGESVLGFALNGETPKRTGNRHPVFAPYGCYRCRGEDRWVTIAVSTEDEWNALISVPGMPDRLRREEFADPSVRRQCHDELDNLIEAWTKRHTRREAMRILQKAGVPAGAVLNAADLLTDEHLQERGFFVEIDHPETGLRKYCGLPMKFSDAGTLPGRPPPTLGQHNAHILGAVLGLSSDEIARLKDSGVIGTEPID